MSKDPNQLQNDYKKAFKENNFEEALKLIKEYLTIKPDDDQAQALKGKCEYLLRRQQKSTQAVNIQQNILDKGNQVLNALGWFNAAVEVMAQANYNTAIEYLSQAIALDKNYQTKVRQHDIFKVLETDERYKSLVGLTEAAVAKTESSQEIKPAPVEEVKKAPEEVDEQENSPKQDSTEEETKEKSKKSSKKPKKSSKKSTTTS